MWKTGWSEHTIWASLNYIGTPILSQVFSPNIITWPHKCFSCKTDTHPNLVVPVGWRFFSAPWWLSLYVQSHLQKDMFCWLWRRKMANLSSTEHIWVELVHRFWARSSHPTSIPDLTNILLAKRIHIPIDTLQHFVPFQRSGVSYGHIGGTNSILMTMVLE